MPHLGVCTLSHLSCLWLCATRWIATCQALLSMEFSRQEHWSGFPCPLQGISLTQGLNLHLLRLPILAGGFCFVLFCLPPVPPKKPTLPGGPVVKNPSCKCRAHGLNLWSGNYNPTCLGAATTEPVCRNYLSPRSTTREYMHRSERSQVMQQRSTKTWHENKYFFKKEIPSPACAECLT